MELAMKAEAFLFVEGGSMTRKKLASTLGCNASELKDVLSNLRERLNGSGLSLIETETEVSLAVAPQVSDAVREALERELSRDIGDAGLEVLAILLYHGSSTRARIDHIRGVNTASTLRTLLTRGLVMREGNPEDAREYLYKPTVELLAHLGVSRVEELPDYATITAELARFSSQSPEDNGSEPTSTNE